MKKVITCFLLISCIICLSGVVFATNFYDIKGTMYEGVVDRIASLGIVNGVSPNVFAANKSVTRAEIAKMLVYVRGLQEYAEDYQLPISFKDTKGHWAQNYIQVAVDLGLLKGYEDGFFRPDKEVSYAETIAIVLRSLGYVNISEDSESTWYSNYVKRMYDIGLYKGISKLSSYTAPAKRGDVAILWWNMLVSDRWVIESQSDLDGLNYTFSDKTQLEILFPQSTYVNGTITSIKNGTSGDTIAVSINDKWYNTNSDVPLISLGATGTGVYDKETDLLYGLSIDDDLSDYKIVSGPIFYLNEQGYKFNVSSVEFAYGKKTSATYAHLLVSNGNERILRTVLINANDSVVVNSVKVDYPSSTKSGDDGSGEKKIGNVYLNGNDSSGEKFTTTEAVIILNGQKVEWTKVPKGAILTTLIPDQLYTYETKSIEGSITDYTKLDELYVDNDKYLVSNDCIYTVYGDDSGDKKELKEYQYSSMTKKKLEGLMNRKITFYLNVAEEIEKIEFGKYLGEKITDKFEGDKFKLFYIQRIYIPSDQTKIAIAGNTFDGKNVRYEVKEDTSSYCVGDLVLVELESEREVKNCQVINANKVINDDTRINYAVKATYQNGAFGEYRVTANTVVYKVSKRYADNSVDKVENCTLTKLSSVEELGDPSKYQLILICNEEMDVDVVLAEVDVNKVSYPVAKVLSLKKVKNSNESGDKNNIALYDARLSVIGGYVTTYKALSGDLNVGELITFEGSGDKVITVKERFRPETLGYAKDLVIEGVNKKTNAFIVNGPTQELNLKEDIYQYHDTTYYLDEYKFLLTTVSKDSETGLWTFTNCNFYQKESLTLKEGDRIAFNELNGIAVVYRGYSE